MNQTRKSTLPSPDYAAAGDFLRVLSILLVAWFHIWQQSWLFPTFRLGRLTLDLTPPVRAGYMLVDLMLMLSGFLLYLPYANAREHSTREFFTRRALRILPSYWFCLLVMLSFALLEPGFSRGGDLLRDLLAHLSFTHNLFQVSTAMTRLNGVLWTLAVEVQFYLLLPLLAPLFRKYPLPAYVLLAGTAFFLRSLLSASVEDTTMFVNRLPVMLDVYANGMLAAHVYARLAARQAHRMTVSVVSTLLCVAALWGIFRVLAAQAGLYGGEEIRRGQFAHRWLLSFCGAVFLASGSLAARPLRALFSNRLVRFLSGISYNFYIWHQWLAVKLKVWRLPPYRAAANPNMEGEQPWQLQYTLACFLGAFVLAVLVTYLVEKPCAKWGRRLLERGNREAAASFDRA